MSALNFWIPQTQVCSAWSILFTPRAVFRKSLVLRTWNEKYWLKYIVSLAIKNHQHMMVCPAAKITIDVIILQWWPWNRLHLYMLLIYTIYLLHLLWNVHNELSNWGLNNAFLLESALQAEFLQCPSSANCHLCCYWIVSIC